MRDPNRIKPFCDDFATLWSRYPDLRCGQIFSNIARYIQLEYQKDIFYIEDDELMVILANMLR